MRVACLLLALCSCASPAATEPAPLRVAAASSLTDVLPALVRELELPPIEARFDASSTLARQIEAGAEEDVFLSADTRWSEHLVSHELAIAGTETPFASNRLVVVVLRSASARVSTLAELSSLEHVAVAGREVPAGRLARESLAREGLLASIEPRLVEAPNVRSALAWVTRGEADAAVVFATDARTEPSVRVAFEVPASTPPAVDVGVVLRGAREAEARAFLSALTSARASAILAAAGFGAPP